MGKKEAIIKTIKAFKLLTSKEIPIEKMYLFGSQATGKAHKWSDATLVHEAVHEGIEI